MSYSINEITKMSKDKEFFIGIDSDGCAFDTMEIKHKECFTPNIINEWDLQKVSKFAREAAEFVNLYSKWRGVNRFPGLLVVFDLLEDRPEAKARGYNAPSVDSLRKWVETETKLGNPALEKAVDETGDPILAKALKWSYAVNDTVAKIVRGVPPFPYLCESLEQAMDKCDMMVVSATPCEALEREWDEHDIAKYVSVIGGQEMGTKKQMLAEANAKSDYDLDKCLMIGDAPGDLRAAQGNGMLFYPINPGNEESSWKRFYEEAYGKFIQGTYKGEYEEALIAEFDTYLPEVPPWRTE